MSATKSIDRATPGGPFRSKDVLILGAWFGLVAGLVEGLSFWVFNAAGWLTWKTRLESVDHNIVWASSLVDVLFFLAVACFLIPAFRLIRLRQQQLFATAIFATMAFYAFLGVSGRLRERGAIMLALGLGVVLSRRMARNPQRAREFLRRSLVWVAIIVLVAGLGVFAGGAVWEKVQLARLPAPPSGAPNVLLIVLDTLRADRLGSYGYQRPTTPFLDDFARDAVRFEKAFANSSWTLPSHISFFTGRLPYEHGATLNPYGGRFPTLAQELTNRGYETVGFVSNTYFATRAYGVSRGFLRWENLFTSPADTVRRTVYGRRLHRILYLLFSFPRLGQMSAEEINHRFLRWLDDRPARPFFAFLNYMEMHSPLYPPRVFAERFSENPEDISSRSAIKFRSQDESQDLEESGRRFREAYDASLAYLDSQLGLLFDELDRRGLTENTLVVITSDHGESLGEHELFGHGKSLYLSEIRVPLLVRFPGNTPPGAVVRNAVGLHTLPATILDILGMQAAPFRGTSLASFWSGETYEPAMILSEKDQARAEVPVPKEWPIAQGWVKSIVTSEWHFIFQENGKEELYRWPEDPQEQQNLVDTPEGESVAAEFRSQWENLFSVRANPPRNLHLAGNK